MSCAVELNVTNMHPVSWFLARKMEPFAHVQLGLMVMESLHVSMLLQLQLRLETAAQELPVAKMLNVPTRVTQPVGHVCVQPGTKEMGELVTCQMLMLMDIIQKKLQLEIVGRMKMKITTILLMCLPLKKRQPKG